MSETYTRLYSTICAGDLLNAINADVIIAPNLNQIINDGTGNLRFIFESALSAPEIVQFDSILSTFVCPVVTSVPSSTVTVDDTVSSNTTIWTSQQVTNALNDRDQLSELLDVQLTTLSNFEVLTFDGTKWTNSPSSTGGTVTNVSVITANGVSGVVANSTSTPAITLTLGNITPLNITTANLSISGTATGLTKTMVGLSNADNTSDINKPISTAQQSSLDLKANISGQIFTGNISATNLSGNNTGDQTITLTGDVTGSGTESFATTLANTTVVPGSYTLTNITVDGKGRITTISNGSAGAGTGTVTSVDANGGTTGFTFTGGPITTTGNLTLAGTLSTANGGTNLTATPTNGQLLIGNGTGYTLNSLTAGSGITITPGAGTISIAATGGGAGTVTSVGLTAPSIFSVTGSPVTTTGNLALALTTQVKNTVFAGPVTGVDAIPTFRTISVGGGDISDLSITTPLFGETLVWNGTQWVNRITVRSGNIPSSSGTTVIPVGTTPPLVTAGTQIATVTFTPLSVQNIYAIQMSLSVSASTNNNVHTAALFRTVNGVSTYIGGAVQTFSSGGNSNASTFVITDIPNTTLPVTYSIRYGTNAGTWYINRRAVENTYGGVRSGWKIEER